MEIGSEFWDAPLSEGPSGLAGENAMHALSGRTALELVARDLKLERCAKSVYMPAYCCDSMLEPFVRQGFEVKLYAVEPFEKTVHRQIFSDHGCDAILLADYFGFDSQETEVIAMAEQMRGAAVILDRVQSAFTPTGACAHADYTVVSWRKWFFSCAATANKHCGDWLAEDPRRENPGYISLRDEAAALKAEYMKRGGDKAVFLERFAKAEALLQGAYSDCAASPDSLRRLQRIDTQRISAARRENAEYIYGELAKLPPELIRPLYAGLGERDVPLFVPVLIKRELRKGLRDHLIANGVYCPIHWATDIGGANKLYDCELSLICDQRYGAEDMAREMMLVREYIDGCLL